MNEQEHSCNGKVWSGFRWYHCSRRCKYYEGEKWWCGTHAPSKVATREKKKQDKFNAERAQYKKTCEKTDLIRALGQKCMELGIDSVDKLERSVQEGGNDH